MTKDEIQEMQRRARELGDELRSALIDAEADNRQLREDVRISPEAANAPCTI